MSEAPSDQRVRRERRYVRAGMMPQVSGSSNLEECTDELDGRERRGRARWMAERVRGNMVGYFEHEVGQVDSRARARRSRHTGDDAPPLRSLVALQSIQKNRETVDRHRAQAKLQDCFTGQAYCRNGRGREERVRHVWMRDKPDDG